MEEGAGILEVLVCVDLGGCEAGKRFVQQPDDPLLFGQRRDGNGSLRKIASTDSAATRAGAFLGHRADVIGRLRVEVEELWQ